MPSFAHEALLALFRECPELAVRLARDVHGLELPPEPAVRVSEADLTQLVPTEFRADLVIEASNDVPIVGLILEIQRQIDPRKPFVWPSYTATLHARLGCQTCLIVIADDPQVAAWAGQPIKTLQPGSPFTPLVLGPEQVPRIVDTADAARSPELAVLSALVHGNTADGLEVATTALAAAATLPDDRATLFHDLILGSLPQVTVLALEKIMLSRKYEYRSEFARRYFTEGVEKGREEGREEGLRAARLALRALVQTRLDALPASIAAMIDDCADPRAIARWIDGVSSAADTATVEAVFSDHTLC